MKFSEFRKKFGEGTDFDPDYGKLFIIGLCITSGTGELVTE